MEKNTTRSSSMERTTQAKKRLASRLSMVGSVGSRMFFHKRGDRLKIPKYQNTYRLEPFCSFNVEVVDALVKETMENKLSTMTAYNPSHASKLCQGICSDLQKAITKKNYDRYKIVVQVSIVQRLDQGIHASFQCLWDVDRDNHSCYVFENNYIYAWCTVFGLYFE